MHVGSYPNAFANAASSSGFISRVVGPSWAIPLMSAGMAVNEPLPSIAHSTSGWTFLNPSLQNVIRLLRVSEPTLDSLPLTASSRRYASCCFESSSDGSDCASMAMTLSRAVTRHLLLQLRPLFAGHRGRQG